MLLRTKQITGATDFQVAHSYLEASAKLRKITDCLQTLFSNFTQRLIRLINKISISQTRAASYAATHLVQLRKAKVISTINNYRIGQGYIKAIFHNSSAQKHITAAFVEGKHSILQGVLIHLSMCYFNADARHQAAQLDRQRFQSTYTVADIVDPAAAA